MASVTVRNAVKSYGTMEVLHGVSLAAQDGEFVVLVGPSGCGKSTLLRMIAGLESITDGDIDIGGRVVNELEPKERDIAMVFQSYALYPHMTVRDNMGFALKLSRALHDGPTDPTPNAAMLVGLEGRVVTPVHAGGTGEVLVRVAGQPMKLTATAEDELPLGSTAVIVAVESATKVVVESSERFWAR